MHARSYINHLNWCNLYFSSKRRGAFRYAIFLNIQIDNEILGFPPEEFYFEHPKLKIKFDYKFTFSENAVEKGGMDFFV